MPQVSRRWRQVLDLPYVWRGLCWREGLLLEGELEGEQEGESEGELEGELEGEAGEEQEKQVMVQFSLPQLSFWASIFRARSLAGLVKEKRLSCRRHD